MSLKLRPIGIAIFALVVGFALMAIVGRAEAQTTNCMSMGSDMVHCNTIGSSGSSSTDCIAVGPDMMTCNSVGGGSAGAGSGGRVASPIDVYRFIFGDRTRRNIGRMLANGDCEGAARYAYEKGRLELGNQISQTCQQNNARANLPAFAAGERVPAVRQSPNEVGERARLLSKTVVYLAKNVPVPFAVNAAAGTFAVTKIEAAETQLRMDVQASDSRLSLDDVASPANLQVICADPNFSEVLRLGGTIHLTFLRESGAVLGVVTQTSQLCGF